MMTIAEIEKKIFFLPIKSKSLDSLSIPTFTPKYSVLVIWNALMNDFNNSLVINTAVKIEARIPIINVNANPLIGPVPK